MTFDILDLNLIYAKLFYKYNNRKINTEKNQHGLTEKIRFSIGTIHNRHIVFCNT